MYSTLIFTSMTDSSQFLSFGIVFWLMPEKASKKWLQTLISDIAKENFGPVFTPHLTLLSKIPLERQRMLREDSGNQQLQELIQTFEPLEIKFTEIGSNSNYYQCCFLQAEYNSKLLKLRDNLSTFFCISSLEKFNPHLSLFYGNQSSISIEKISSFFNFSEPLVIRFDQLEAHRIEGEITNWKYINSYDLKS